MEQKTIKLGDGFSTNSYMRLPEGAIEALCRRYVVRLGGNPDSPETHHSNQYQHFKQLFDQLAVLAEMGLIPKNLKPLPSLTQSILRSRVVEPNVFPNQPQTDRIPCIDGISGNKPDASGNIILEPKKDEFYISNPEALPDSDGIVEQKQKLDGKKFAQAFDDILSTINQWVDKKAPACKNAELEQASIISGTVRKVSWFRPLPLVRFSSYEYESFAVIGKIHGNNMFVEKGWFGEYVNIEHQTSAIKQAAHERARKKTSTTVHSYSPPTPPMPPRPKPNEGKFDPHAK
jgi:hypothetical protein